VTQAKNMMGKKKKVEFPDLIPDEGEFTL